MSEWFFFMSSSERRASLDCLLKENGATIVSGNLHDSQEVRRYTDTLPDKDLETLFPNGAIYLLPPFGSDLVVEPVGNTARFAISAIKGGPHSHLSLPRFYPGQSPPSLKPGVLSRKAEFWDNAVLYRTPVTDEFKRWHESLKKTLQRRLKKVGRVWISADALASVRAREVVPVLTPADIEKLM